MKLITGITDAPVQTFGLILEDGSKVSGTLRFRDQQTGWFLDVTYGTVVINGLRLVSTPNLLRQFREIIPFGLAFTMPAGADPFDLEAFSTGTFALLEGTDLSDIENTFFPGLY
ncbi:MAG: hypothetical protein WCG85_16630 [Polyangia bacterium]